MHVRLVAGDGAKRCHYQRQSQHQRHQPGRYAQLDNHHAVERADHQGGGHAHSEFEERQAQQTRQRQAGARDVCKWQPAGRHLLGVLGKGVGSHDRNHSIAWDL